MKLTLPLITLLVTICSAESKKDESKKQHHPHHSWDYKLEYLKSKNTLHYLQLSQKQKRHSAKVHKRDPQFDSPPIIDVQDDPPTFLPPPWSPHSDLDSPYPLSGVSPWDDSGRSQILDNEPSVQMWRTCPEHYLDCRKCPRDPKCRRPGFPWWSPTDIFDLPAALTGPQLAAGTDLPTSIASGVDICPLSTCGSATSLSSCGTNARCVRNHCVCKLGYKGATENGPVVRGFEDLQAVTVWVDTDMACDVPCDSPSCAEVQQVKACFENGAKVEDKEYAGQQELETDAVHGGAVQVPGAVVDEGADYVQDVAASGSYGEVN
ncbi:Nn.00g016210.m01.CDS01 [Neocucurbitaria sp. VM-36]